MIERFVKFRALRTNMVFLGCFDGIVSIFLPSTGSKSRESDHLDPSIEIWTWVFVLIFSGIKAAIELFDNINARVLESLNLI